MAHSKLKIKLKIKCFKISNVVFSISFLFTFLCLIYYEYNIFLYILKFVFGIFWRNFFISISNFFFHFNLYFLNLLYFNFKILITLLVYQYGNDGPP